MHGRPLILALAFLAAAFVCSACADRGKPGPRAEEGGLVARRGPFRDRILLGGELAAARSEVLGVPRTREFQLQVRWLAEDGQTVAAGERLVEFDNSRFSSEIEEKRLAAANAANRLALKAAQGKTAVSERAFAIRKAENELEKARIEAAIPPGLLSLREDQERQLAVSRAEAALAQARSDAETAGETQGADVAVERIALDKARREIDDAESSIQALTLRAPRRGIVLIGEHPWEGRRLQVGDNVFPGMPVASLPDLGSMQVEADLSDVDDGKVRPGMRVTCVLDAFPGRSYSGRIVEISPVARESRRSPLLRSFPVLIALDRPDPERMRPGMSVRVEVAGAERPGSLLVPRAALDLNGAKPRAALSDGGYAEVTLGPCSASECVVESGLPEGARLRSLAPGAG